jgi:hypothetical protein
MLSYTTYRVPECSNYEFYHWFFYALATLVRITDVSGPIYFTVPTNELEFQLSSFKYIAHTYTYTPILLGPSVYLKNITIDENNIPKEKEIYPFLRKIFYEKNTFPDWKPLSRKIYISRKKNTNVTNRTVVNESEFLEALTARGFEIIYLEDYILDDKIKIFYEASIIVTTVGAALSLGIFLDKKARVIEIIEPIETRGLDNFMHIYENLQIPFKRYIQVSTEWPEKAWWPNYIVKDIDHFLKAIDDEIALLNE